MADPKFHKVTPPKTIKELADLTGSELHGVDSTMIIDVAPLQDAGAGHITFFDNVKYKDDFIKTKASACIVHPKMVDLKPKGCQLLVSTNPYKAYALIAQAFYPQNEFAEDISKAANIDDSAEIGNGCCIEAGAVISASVTIGKNCHVEANVVIGENVEIGDNCRIGANASVSHAIIGQATRLYPGVRVGQDGFGFAMDPAGHVKVPQLGRVIIGDHVEVGANTCIDRGAGPDTIIGDGTWIDNLVQIGHNAQIGRGCVIIGQAGIAGSTKLEDFVVVAAQVGVAGHLTIGQGSQIGAQSGVMKNLPAGSKVVGSPALPIKQFMRQVGLLKKMTKTDKK